MAIKPFNSVGGISVGETPVTIILSNGDITTSNANLTGNLYVTNTANVGNLRTDHLLYANGTPWDLQEAAGNTWQVQYNVGNNFAASANFTYDDSVQNLTILGNANITKTFFGNVANFSGNVIAPNLTVNLQLSGNTANFTGNLTSLNANLGNLATANYINVSSNITVTNLVANTNVNFSSAGNVTLGPVGNLHITGGTPDQILKTDGNGNLSWSSGTSLANGFSNVTIPNANGNVYINANAGVDQQWIFGSDGNLTGPASGLANLGNLVIANNVNVAQQINGNIANFTGNLTALNANLGNLATANFVNVSSNVNVTNTIQAGNVRTDHLLYANGNPWDLQEAAGANTQIQYNDGNGNFGASSALAFDYLGNVLNVTGNANVTGTTETANAKVSTIANTQVVYANANSFLVGSSNFVFDDLGSNLTVTGNIIATGSFVGNISGNLTAPGANTQIVFNDNTVANAVANFTYDKAYNSGGGRLNVGNTVGGEIITDSLYTGYANINGNVDVSNNIVANGNITTNGVGGNITMSGGNITGVNDISANTANFSGNVVAANLTGALANGTSNIKIYQNANVAITIGGSANSATFSSTGLYVAGDINSTTGNITSNGSVTANGVLNGANANVTGQAILGSVLTSNITAPTGTVTISAAGANNNIILSPTGVGNVDVGLHNITQVATPVNPNDAATKEYVDNISQGLYIHPSANVTTTTNLNASYLNGGTVLSVTTITGGTTLTFSTNHGLSLDSDIEFTNSFNGIIAGEGYFVFSIPAPNQITIKNGYYGTQITTLTNATGLTQPALGEGGIGATLTNAGAQAPLTIDSILMTVGARVLVQGQTNQAQNGIYAVTTVGTISTNWVLTRASDGNSYAPKSDSQLGAGSYFFVTQGTQYAGTSYVLTNPPGEIHFGTSNITFAQFGTAGGYTAGNGIYINGTIISANVDNVTTAIVGGNITVKTSANLTTPNIGDATFSSLSWNNLSNGNVSANNLSIGNVANIGSNLIVGGIIRANGNISSNALISGNTASFTNSANVGGNLIANNITSNNAFSTNTANVSSNLITSNATVNLSLTGNTANFSGNVIVPNLTVNLQLAGNTANFSGNVIVPNLTVNLALTGNTANFSGNVIVPAIIQNASTYNTSITLNSASGVIEANTNANATQFLSNGTVRLSPTGTTQIVSGASDGAQLELGANTSLSQVRGGNVVVQVGTGGAVTKTWTFAQDGSLYTPGNINVTNIVSNVLTANTAVNIGNTSIAWGTYTSNTITANQTIGSFSVSSVTGVEFLVKAIDATGSKYSVATVQAVTDGSNVDYSTYGTVNLGGQTGVLAVNVVSGNVKLQVTPASSNSTVWTTQVRFI